MAEAIVCPSCGFDPYDMIFYAVKQEFPDRNPRDVIEEMSDEEYKDEAEFYVFENHQDYCPSGMKKDSETFEAMSWHDPRWAGDRENVEAKFKAMYPTYTIDDSSVDYLIYSGGNSNKFHVFFLATDPAGNYHSFNAYGRIGYTPTLHHNAGPGTKGSVTQAISKKRQQKAKKGYVQQAESFEADFDYYYTSYNKARGMEILDRLRTMNPETKAEAIDWLIDNGFLHSEEVFNSAYVNAMGDALYITEEEDEEEYDAEGLLTKSDLDSYANRLKDHQNELNELENQLSVSSHSDYKGWRSWIGLPDRMPSVITTSQDRKIVQKMESINTEIKGLIKKMYPNGFYANWNPYADKNEMSRQEMQEALDSATTTTFMADGMYEDDDGLMVCKYCDSTEMTQGDYTYCSKCDQTNFITQQNMNAESFGAEASIKIEDEDGGYQCGKCYTGFEDEDAADYCCSACYACGYADHVGFERGQKCCSCDCDETGGGPNGTCQEMNAESFAYRVFDKVLSEKDYEKVELAKPIRTGWGIGAGLTLFSATVAVITVSVVNLFGKKGDEE